MKFNMKILCAMMLIGALGILPPCHAGEKSSDVTSLDTVKQEARHQKEETIQKTKEALDDLDHRIDELESHVDKNWDRMSQTAREKSRDSLRALRRQRIKVAEWYGSLKASAGNTWKHTKKGFSDAFNDLKAAWKKSEKEFGANR